MRRHTFAILALAGTLAAACTRSAASSIKSPAATRPATTAPTSTNPADLEIAQANFVDTVDNPWFPLTPGTTFTFKGTKDDKVAVDVVRITGETKVVAGVRCTVVHDALKLDGKLAERTEDWYVQDKLGNVWYFGEATEELDENGKVVTTSGSWEALVNGARPGIFMPADPQAGQSFQQEYFAGEAEDRFVVLHTIGTAKVPYGSFKNTLVTAEWTTLEPDVLTEKYYVKGIGQIREIDVAGGDEGTALVSISTS